MSPDSRNEFVLPGDTENPIFCITMMVSLKGLSRDLCDRLEPITTSINQTEYIWV